MSNLSVLVGIIGGLVGIAIAVAALLKYISTGPNRREVIIRSSIIGVVVICIIVLSGFISTSTNIVVHAPNIPFVPNATDPPTATPSPTPTLSPTPTPITITKNLDIPCTKTCAIALKLTTIVINTTTQTSTWNFTLTNTSDSVTCNFSTLELEDSTGQKHQGGGPAKTDHWNMISGQTIQTNAIFDVAHGTNNLLNISISYNTWYTDTHQTETITF